MQDLYPITSKYLSSLNFSEVKKRITSTGATEHLWDVVKQNLITLDDFQYWLNLIVDGVEPLVDDLDRDYVNQALLLMPSAPLNEQSWGNWTNDIKLTSSRKGKQLFLPLRKALTGKEKGPDMSRLLPLLQKIPKQI